MQVYKSIITHWASKMEQSKDAIVFSYEDEELPPDILSLYFGDSFIKGALQYIFIVFGTNPPWIEQKIGQQLSPMIDNARFIEFNQLLENLSHSVMNPDTVHVPLSQQEIHWIEQLPKHFFAEWLLFYLDNNVKPFANRLEHAFAIFEG